MADQKPAEMASQQSESAWGYFTNFWKYFFILCAVIMFILLIVGT